MRWSVGIFVSATAVWIASSVVLLTGDWYVVCDHGTRQGIDCFDANVLPTASGGAASWLGFGGWLALAVSAFVVAAVLVWRMRKLGHSSSRS